MDSPSSIVACRRASEVTVRVRETNCSLQYAWQYDAPPLCFCVPSPPHAPPLPLGICARSGLRHSAHPRPAGSRPLRLAPGHRNAFFSFFLTPSPNFYSVANPRTYYNKRYRGGDVEYVLRIVLRRVSGIGVFRRVGARACGHGQRMNVRYCYT